MFVFMLKEFWEEFGRWVVFGLEMFRIKDRNEREYCLGFIYEEVFIYIVRNEIMFYRDFFKILY